MVKVYGNHGIYFNDGSYFNAQVIHFSDGRYSDTHMVHFYCDVNYRNEGNETSANVPLHREMKKIL